MKNIPPLRVLAVDPPGEIQKQFVEDAFEKFQIALVLRIGFAPFFAIHLKNAPRCPRVDGRVHVAERPFVGGELAIRVHEPFAREQIKLTLGKVWIHERERNAVERQIPRGIPRILPLVRHRNDVGVVEVRPLGVARVLAGGGRRRLAGIAVEPFADVEMIKLFRPNHARERLPLNGTQVVVLDAALHVGVKFIRLGDALGKNLGEVGEGFRGGLAGEAQLDFARAAGGNFQFVMRAHFRASALGVHGVFISADEIVMEGVLEKSGGWLAAENAVGVRLVVAEQKFGRIFFTRGRGGGKFIRAQLRVFHRDG